MFTARNIRCERSERVAGLGPGGIGAMHLLKEHKPYQESAHVVNIACNLPVGGGTAFFEYCMQVPANRLATAPPPRPK